MEDVTGFNQKNAQNDGEALIANGLKSLRVRYQENIIEIIRLMLRFDEGSRPSFVELGKLVLNDDNEPEVKKTGGPMQRSHSKGKSIGNSKSNGNLGGKENS